jgi:hypothetical protein
MLLKEYAVSNKSSRWKISSDAVASDWSVGRAMMCKMGPAFWLLQWAVPKVDWLQSLSYGSVAKELIQHIHRNVRSIFPCIIACYCVLDCAANRTPGWPCHSQAVSRWLPTAAAWVRARIWSCGICGGVGFLRVFRFPLSVFIPPIAPQSSSSTIRGWYNRLVVAAVPSGCSLTAPRIIVRNRTLGRF